MDAADRASTLQHREIEAGIRRVNKRVSFRRDGDPITCRECETPIPESRRRARPGCELCIDCQRERES